MKKMLQNYVQRVVLIPPKKIAHSERDNERFKARNTAYAQLLYLQTLEFLTQSFRRMLLMIIRNTSIKLNSDTHRKEICQCIGLITYCGMGLICRGMSMTWYNADAYSVSSRYT